MVGLMTWTMPAWPTPSPPGGKWRGSVLLEVVSLIYMYSARTTPHHQFQRRTLLLL